MAPEERHAEPRKSQIRAPKITRGTEESARGTEESARGAAQRSKESAPR
jgi:hypothetical protein